MNTLASESYVHSQPGDGYERFRELIADRVANATGPLFTTADQDLCGPFLAQLPHSISYYNCQSCRRFIDTYGGLVTIDPNGVSHPLLWREFGDPQFFGSASYALYRRIQRAPVNGVFVSDKRVWGTPETPPWTHLYGRPPEALIWTRQAKTASQEMAELQEDHRILVDARTTYPLPVIREAIRVMQSLPWNARFGEQLEWLARAKQANYAQMWAMVATAPAGWCHVKTSMVGTLLEDIANGLPYDDVRARFQDKMHPLQYRRPQALPSEGNIEQAEKLVAKLGLERSLLRRFATMADVMTIWQPVRKGLQAAERAVFGHLKLKDRAKVPAYTIQMPTMTWVKFATQVLTGATRMETYLPDQSLPLGALVTAVDPSAPTLFQWSPPVTWYLYHQGSHPMAWGLKPRAWAQVTGLVRHPATWVYTGPRPSSRDTDLVIWMLEGCRDQNYTRGGSFFPSMLKSEYHAIRSTLEAYAKDAVIADHAHSDACGLFFQGNRAWNLRVRVNGADEYLIDRWD